MQTAQKSVLLDPTWAEAYQTLGRTQISIGEIELVKWQLYLLTFYEFQLYVEFGDSQYLKL